MVAFTNDAAGLKTLNDLLLNASYLEGVEPSGADFAAADQISLKSVSDYPNVARWLKHMMSYSVEERLKFPVAALPAPEAAKEAPAEAADDDDFDPFADDDDDEEAYKIQQARAEAALKAKEERDAAKAAAGKKKEDPKSQIIFDIKPWDDTTDLAAMEKAVRAIEIDGAVWGAAKKAPVGYGIMKLQIICTINDNKVPSTEIIEEEIQELEDYVQSVDVAAFNKL